MTRVKLNALDKDSSGSFSEFAEGNTVEELQKAEKDFESRVPFSRFYFDHEFEEGDEDVFEEFNNLT